MLIFPAIDLYDKKAVRLLKGDYSRMTVYSEDPLSVAQEFERCGASCIHMVDLEGARDGSTPNIGIVEQVVRNTGLFVEIGGGIRSMETLHHYLNTAGADRAVLGTAAVQNEAFLREAVEKYGPRIAVGADVKDGHIAIKGWLETADITLDDFMYKMQSIGVSTVICTDISRDGAMRGTNLQLYRQLAEKYELNITASGGISTLDDLRELRRMEMYGAIIGKAYYTGAIRLEDALEVAR